MCKQDPGQMVQDAIIEARRLVQLARTSRPEQAVNYWLDAGLMLGRAERLIGDCVNQSRSRCTEEVECWTANRLPHS